MIIGFMAVEYELGQTIKDPRYTGKNFLGHSIENMPYSPNKDWVPPIYYPFKLDQLIAVHLTNQDARASGELKPHSYTPVQFKYPLTEDLENKWLLARETLHFTLNGMVADHSGGMVSPIAHSWRDRRFAYLVPLKDIYSQVISVFTHDTIVLGKIRLPESVTVIEDQTRGKIVAAISDLGYQPFDIQGVKELDPAYLWGTKTNINHIINFSSMIDGRFVDGPYISPSLNNILALDTLLSNVLTCIGNGNYVITPSAELIEAISRRIDFLTSKFETDKERGEAILRLRKMVGIYTDCLSEYLKCQEDFDEAMKTLKDLPFERYTEILEMHRERKRAISRMLAWREIPK